MIKIRILPENVASQIAAGEVVDRPSSIVRELMDNSIDAGADRITVRVENGGKGMIRVVDNGIGMSRNDLILCIERHATSKIAAASDLLSVKSLGFRGEAIPSIASVSRMQITSRPKDQIEGFRLRISGGVLKAVEETGTPPGTIVEVADLFFNLPARRKFLRGSKTETDHIIDTFSRMVLPFPGIHFRLEQGGKTIMDFPASEQIPPRLFSLMGRKTVEAMVDSEQSYRELSIRAFLAPPDMDRSRADRLFFYINNRHIRDRLITRAVMEGYGQRLMKGRYPQAVLFIEMDPSLVDVNVHPTKQEVRFHSTRNVFEGVASAVQKALSKIPHPFLRPDREGGTGVAAPPVEGFLFAAEPVRSYPAEKPFFSLPKIPFADPPALSSQKTPEQSISRELPKVIGQLGNTYILCQAKDGLLLIDQHAAHERVVYETLKKSLFSSRLEAQNLLLPYELEFSSKEARIALDKKDQFLRLGLELDHFGGNTFLLRSHPAILKDVQWDDFFSEMLAGVEQGQLEDEAVMDRMIAVMACHGAIRAGAQMSGEEMTLLISQLEEMDLPTNCPHGRPVFKHFSYYEIEKMFKRVV